MGRIARLRVRCPKCGYEWDYTGQRDIGYRAECPRCSHKVLLVPENILKAYTPELKRRLEAYQDSRRRWKVRCPKCDAVWIYRGRKGFGGWIKCLNGHSFRLERGKTVLETERQSKVQSRGGRKAKMLVKCPGCGYTWAYTGSRTFGDFIICPNCNKLLHLNLDSVLEVYTPELKKQLEGLKAAPASEVGSRKPSKLAFEGRPSKPSKAEDLIVPPRYRRQPSKPRKKLSRSSKSSGPSKPVFEEELSKSSKPVFESRPSKSLKAVKSEDDIKLEYPNLAPPEYARTRKAVMQAPGYKHEEDLVPKRKPLLSKKEYDELLEVAEDALQRTVRHEVRVAIEEAVKKVRARYSEEEVSGFFLLQQVRQLLQMMLISTTNRAVSLAIDDLLDVLAFKEDMIENI